MKKNILLFLILTTLFPAAMSAQNWDWAKSAGGAQKVESYAIAIDSAGNNYITGWFEDSLKFGTTTIVTSTSGNAFASDIFIAKYDADGDFVWAKRAGGTNYDYGNGIATDAAGNAYITGLFTGTATFGTLSITSTTVDYDVFIAKYDANGNALWVKKGGGNVWDVGNGITVDKFNNCYITGAYRNTATFGTSSFTSAGNYDIYIAKYDSDGNFIWAQSAGGTDDDRGMSVSTDASGNCYITGFFKGTVTIATNTLVSAGDSDILLAKYNTVGIAQWAKRAGGIAADEGSSIKTGTSGNIYVTGYFTDMADFDTSSLTAYGNADIFVAKYDYKGDIIWVKKYGGTQNDKGYGISADTFNNIYVTGSFWGTGQFDTINAVSYNQDDAFVAGIDNQDKTKWVLHGGGVNIDVGRGIAASDYGRCYITGYFSGSAAFGANNITGFADNDLFVAKVDSTFIYDSVPINAGIKNTVSKYSRIAVYPNPFTTTVTVNIETTASITQVELFDIVGKTAEFTITEMPGSSIQKQLVIHSEELANGVYFLKVMAGNQVYAARLMLVK